MTTGVNGNTIALMEPAGSPLNWRAGGTRGAIPRMGLYGSV
jgi:hypothetical protein